MVQIFYEDEEMAILSEEAYLKEDEFGTCKAFYTRPQINNDTSAWKILAYHVMKKAHLHPFCINDAKKYLPDVEERYRRLPLRDKDIPPHLGDAMDSCVVYYKKLKSLQKSASDLKREKKKNEYEANLKVFESIIKPSIQVELSKLGLRIQQTVRKGVYIIVISDFMKTIQTGLFLIENYVNEIFTKTHPVKLEYFKTKTKQGQTYMSENTALFQFKIKEI